MYSTVYNDFNAQGSLMYLNFWLELIQCCDSKEYFFWLYFWTRPVRDLINKKLAENTKAC